MHEELKDRAAASGTRAFGPDWNVDSWAVAPGRIELIGNHIDYNGGPVLAAAIDRVLVIAAGPIADPARIALAAPDVTNEIADFAAFSVTNWKADEQERGPVVYVKGVVAALVERGIPFRSGVGLSVAGNIPPGFGMSSSAAFCVATILALTIDDIAPGELVAIAREAEHRAGSPVGAMDQSASVAGNVILFDGRDNSFSSITPDLGDLVFALADSGVDRSLRVSSYGTRVAETRKALGALRESLAADLPSLAAVEPHWESTSASLKENLPPVLLRRVRHVVTETRRVRQAEQSLRVSDWETFGDLMNASGESSAHDYDISHPLVEELVQTLRLMDGVLGARMMGGGEGGPALVLLRRNAVESVASALQESFYREHPVRNPEPFQVCSFGSGARREPA
jgi:galactokinase